MAILSPNLYVKPEGRKYLSEGHYVFTVDNKSISEYYILNPFWNWVTHNIIPDFVAPNVVTFAGFVLIIICYALIWLSYPFCDDSTIYLAIAPILMFLYQTLDGCDGKQARRTGASSPLGELFDHGVDALCMTFFCQSLLTLLGLSAGYAPIVAALTVINMWFSFYSAHWEHYHTDYFFMGYIGACDGQLIIIGVYFVGILAHVMNPVLYPTVPHFFLNNTITVPILQIELTYAAAWIAFAHVNGFGAVGRCIVAIFIHYWKGLDKNHNTNKRSSFLGAMTDLLPLTLMSLTWFTWICINHFLSAPIPPVSSIYPNHPIAPLTTVWQRDNMWFVSTGGLAFGLYLTTINISRVTNQKLEYISFQNITSIGLMAIQILNSLIRVVVGSAIVEETLLLRIICIVMLIIYLDFAIDISLNFSKAMNIWVFQLGKRDPKLASVSKKNK